MFAPEYHGMIHTLDMQMSRYMNELSLNQTTPFPKATVAPVLKCLFKCRADLPGAGALLLMLDYMADRSLQTLGFHMAIGLVESRGDIKLSEFFNELSEIFAASNEALFTVLVARLQDKLHNMLTTKIFLLK